MSVEEYSDSDILSETEFYSKPEYVEYSDDNSSTANNLQSSSLEYKQSDKGFHMIKIKKKGEKSSYFEFYETAIFPKTTIRNAVTGDRYRGCHVGTKDEDLFFKVINSSAELKNKDPFILFYETPEQWEIHTNTKCPTSIKNKWNAKFLHQMKKKKS